MKKLLFLAFTAILGMSVNAQETLLSERPEGIVKPKSVIRDSFLLFLMTAIRKSQLYLSDCQ